MIVLCEPVCWGKEHVPFNSGMLEIIRTAFPEEEIFFFGEKRHIEQVEEQVSKSIAESIHWMPIVIPDRRAQYSKRFVLEVRIIKNLFHIFPRTYSRTLVFTTVLPSTLTILKLLQRIARNKMCLQAVLHSIVSSINGRRSRHPIRRIQDIKTALTIFGRSNIQYLVLEEFIRDAILKSLPSLSGRIEVLEHPLPPNEGESASTDLDKPIRFGFLGLVNEQKGFPMFTKLASQMITKHKGQAEFHSVGFTNAKDPMQGVDVLTSTPSLEWLSRRDFIEGLKQLHFAIFPYRMGHYELTASGVLLDAIAWGKPIIARNIPIFYELFKKYGDIGYLFDNDSELADITENIIVEFNQARYDRQRLNILKARRARVPGALAKTYREIRNKVISN